LYIFFLVGVSLSSNTPTCKISYIFDRPIKWKAEQYIDQLDNIPWSVFWFKW